MHSQYTHTHTLSLSIQPVKVKAKNCTYEKNIPTHTLEKIFIS